MATTRSRSPRGREQARHASGGAPAEHAGKVYAVAITGAVIILAFLTLTSTGHLVDAAVQHFMLYYAGVFALIALCASVGLGLVATDRMFLRPGHRVFLQSAHRAVSFGAVAFLIVHIFTEILAQRVHVLDAFIPFLSPFRTFYLGLGTIASDLIILLVITGIYRKRFTANGKAWRWRAIHYTSYAAFVFGVWHGLLAGRPGKPYVDWSYGLVIALVVVGLAVRILANSLRPKESLSSPPASEATSSVSMFAQLGMARATAPGRAGGLRMTGSGRHGVLTASTRTNGAVPVLASLSAPVTGEVLRDPVSGRTIPVRAAGGAGSWRAEPVYEPGYEGPPRYRGAPRDPSTGPQPRAATGPRPRSTTGPQPRAGTGPQPRATSGPMPRATSGPMPRATSGPMPWAATGPLPRRQSGPMPQAPSGPLPTASSGPLPRTASGPLPRATSGPLPRAASGPLPRANSGPLPRAASGPMPRANSGPLPRAASGPLPRANSGPLPRANSGPLPRAASGPMPRANSGPLPRANSGPLPRATSGPLPRANSGPLPRANSGPLPRAASGPMPRAGTGPLPQSGYPARPPAPAGPMPGSMPPGAGGIGGGVNGAVRNVGNAMRPAAGGNPWDTGVDPELRYREPGPGMPGYRGGWPRGDDPYAGDPYATGPYGTDHYAPPPQGSNPYDGHPYGWDGRL